MYRARRGILISEILKQVVSNEADWTQHVLAERPVDGFKDTDDVFETTDDLVCGGIGYIQCDGGNWR